MRFNDLCTAVQQSTILRDSVKGFVFESNRGTRVPITAETPLGRFGGVIGSNCV